jgi:hypothetical protein
VGLQLFLLIIIVVTALGFDFTNRAGVGIAEQWGEPRLRGAPGSTRPGCGLWFVVGGRAGVRGWGRRV